MKSEPLFVVYFHHCIISGKGYVGVTSQGVRSRLYSHAYDARSGSDRPFARAIRKYGLDAFETIILQTGLTEEEAFVAEGRWIDELGTYGRGGYNATRGGEGTVGFACSPERRDAISAMFKKLPRTEEHRRRCSEALRGRILKPEHVEKMADARRGVPQSADWAAKSRAALAKAKTAWTACKHSGESKRRMRDAKARLLVIYRPDGSSILQRTTYRDLAEGSGISHSAIAASVKYRRAISKECALKGCRIVPFTEMAMSLEAYELALNDPAGQFA